MKFCDGPRGVVCGTDKTTCLPVAMLRGATFDTELEEKIEEVIAEEILVFGEICLSACASNCLIILAGGDVRRRTGKIRSIWEKWEARF